MKRFATYRFAALAAASMALPTASASAESVMFDFVDDDSTPELAAASALVENFDRGGSVGDHATISGLTLTVVDIIGQNGESTKHSN